MNRDEKGAIVSELTDSFNRAKLTVVADYCGLKVSEFQEVRIELKNCDSEVRVAKNTLLKRAVTDTDFAALSDSFAGTTAVVMGYSDPVGPAKVVTKFADSHDKFVIRSVALDGQMIEVAELVALAKLPSREVLLSQLLSTMSAVPTGFVRVLSGVPQAFVYALQGLKDKKESGDN